MNKYLWVNGKAERVALVRRKAARGRTSREPSRCVAGRAVASRASARDGACRLTRLDGPARLASLDSPLAPQACSGAPGCQRRSRSRPHRLRRGCRLGASLRRRFSERVALRRAGRRSAAAHLARPTESAARASSSRLELSPRALDSGERTPNQAQPSSQSPWPAPASQPARAKGVPGTAAALKHRRPRVRGSSTRCCALLLWLRRQSSSSPIRPAHQPGR
jgi:hypothetical protein